MAISVLNKLIISQVLLRGDGPVVMPDHRRRERLFGSAGRTKATSGFKLESVGKEYNPRGDTCIKAFVRFIAALAATAAAEA